MCGEGPTCRQHRRKTLTYQRNGNSIDTAQDESNYNQVEIPSDEKIVTGYIPDKVHKNKKIEVSFSSHKPSVAGCQRRCDVINNRPGLTAYSKDADTTEKAFALFLTDEMLASICAFTNVRINDTLYARFPGSNNYPQFKETSIIEMKAFLGLMYYHGLYGMNMHLINVLFSERHGPPVFSVHISRIQVFVSTYLFDTLEMTDGSMIVLHL